MGFKIIYPNGDEVPHKILTEESSELWGRKEEPIVPVYPNPWDSESPELYTWDKIIGIIIATVEVKMPNWRNVKEALLMNQLEDSWRAPFADFKETIEEAVEYLEPYFKLIDLWEEKKYRPIKTSE